MSIASTTVPFAKIAIETFVSAGKSTVNTINIKMDSSLRNS